MKVDGSERLRYDERMTECTLRRGVCTRVIDGDTMTVRFAGEKRAVPVQLAAVSAPEKGEPYAKEAAAYLSALLGEGELSLHALETDRFGRVVCRLFRGERDINRAMVLAGFARYHHRYGDTADFAAAEAEAIAAKRGMWATLTPKSGAPAAEKTGTCLKVLDGDTIIFREEGAVDSIKIRLRGIDAPESDQEFGPEATRKLARRIEHKQVLLRFHTDAKESAEGRDGYSRDLATIYRKGCNINLEMVQGGFAWHYAYYAADDTELAEAEQAARAAKLGLWAADNPLEPRRFRRAQKLRTNG